LPRTGPVSCIAALVVDQRIASTAHTTHLSLPFIAVRCTPSAMLMTFPGVPRTWTPSTQITM
jgi:hypothetical protein